MRQISLAATGFELVTMRTRKRWFLDEMNLLMSWTELVGLIEPFAVIGTMAKRGRLSFAVESMLRIHSLQQWCGLSDPVTEEALHDASLYCVFAKLNPGIMRLPEETTILRFGIIITSRYLLEEHYLSIQLVATVDATLVTKDLMLKTDTVVNVTLLVVPSSTKNSTGERDPEMHKVKRGNQWYFGMKKHIGVDADSGLVHAVICTAANVNDVAQGHGLLHWQEQVAGYKGSAKRPEATGVDWQVTMRLRRRKAPKRTPWGAVSEQAEKLKASVRAKVEHPFRVIKCQFGFTKVRYKGLAKNTVELVRLFALSNLCMSRWRILPGAQG